MADVKTSKTGSGADVEKPTSSAGVFGFAGTTLFQPGQPLFSGEPEVLPYKHKPDVKAADLPE